MFPCSCPAGSREIFWIAFRGHGQKCSSKDEHGFLTSRNSEQVRQFSKTCFCSAFKMVSCPVWLWACVALGFVARGERELNSNESVVIVVACPCAFCSDLKLSLEGVFAMHTVLCRQSWHGPTFAKSICRRQVVCPVCGGRSYQNENLYRNLWLCAYLARHQSLDDVSAGRPA